MIRILTTVLLRGTIEFVHIFLPLGRRCLARNVLIQARLECSLVPIKTKEAVAILITIGFDDIQG